jgi:hypothetical protein
VNDPIVAHVEFVGGVVRPVYEDAGGRQYVYDDDGNTVAGVWFLPADECDQPVIVEREG